MREFFAVTNRARRGGSCVRSSAAEKYPKMILCFARLRATFKITLISGTQSLIKKELTKFIRLIAENMSFDIQPLLENEKAILYPLRETDFDRLYAVASDPKVWEQHPNKDRWKKEVFRTFFDGAMESRGAYLIVDKATGDAIGSTRFYDYNEAESSIIIGYTFYAVSSWGKGVNLSVKATMLDYIFRFVSKVIFQIGAENVRSQIAIGRLGAEKIAEQEITYFGEQPKLNFVYRIEKSQWIKRRER